MALVFFKLSLSSNIQNLKAYSHNQKRKNLQEQNIILEIVNACEFKINT